MNQNPEDDNYDELIKSMEFDKKVEKLSKMLEEQRQEFVAWMTAAYEA